jgi:hypothetical protein
MAYDIRLVKLINGETVIGKWSEDGKTLNDPAVLQTVQAQGGVQMMLMPFGYPFENEMSGEISTAHVLYEYKKAPEELKTKYLEASSSLTLSTSGGLGGLGGMGGGDISSLLK